jgi:UDP-N-acetylmuramyl pentapeptide synthase
LHYPCAHIEELLHADRLNTILQAGTITQVCIDSRQITFPQTSLFFALRGNRRDGHQYLATAYQKGIRNFVVTGLLIRRVTQRPTFFE